MIPLLQGIEQVQYAEEDEPVYEDSRYGLGAVFAPDPIYAPEPVFAPDPVYAPGETIATSVARSIGNSLLGFPFPRKSAHHCDDPNVMKIAIVDGGKDKRV